MTSSLIGSKSTLILDVGDLTTRAFLIDSVGNRYRLLAVSDASTTDTAPANNIGDGILRAIRNLQETIDRPLLDENQRLIKPVIWDGSGVDQVAGTISVGRPLKILVVGLMQDISLTSALHLAKNTYSGIIETISLGDFQNPEEKIETILDMQPDLIIIAGGTEGGAFHSLEKLIDLIAIACHLLPDHQRPEVQYVGNQAVSENVKAVLEDLCNLHIAPNVRPSLDVEDLTGAQNQLADITKEIRGNQISGVRELDRLTNGKLMPAASAFGWIIRFLSKARTPEKGVLGVNIDASATTIAAGFDGKLALGVFPDIGLGANLEPLLDAESINQIKHWLPLEIPEQTLKAYLINKQLYPESIPITMEDSAIESALVRYIIRTALQRTKSAFPDRFKRPEDIVTAWFEPILASGDLFARLPSLRHSLLLLLDSIQPTGATTMVLDPLQIARGLGAVASIDPIKTVQVLDSNAFIHLGTVVSPVGNAKPGTPILRVIMNDDSGYVTNMEITQGSIDWLPLPYGRTASLRLHPLQKFDVGMGGAGQSGTLIVKGGAFGLVVDGRGRPLSLPDDPDLRHQKYQEWLNNLRGQGE